MSFIVLGCNEIGTEGFPTGKHTDQLGTLWVDKIYIEIFTFYVVLKGHVSHSLYLSFLFDYYFFVAAFVLV